MEKETNDYHISFFKPTTARAKANRNKVIYLVSIWAIAIFGFQFLLRVLEKPTPEPEYTRYSEVWEAVQAGEATNEELRVYGKAALHVLSKVFLEDQHRAILDSELNGVLYTLADSIQRVHLQEQITAFKELQATAIDVQDPVYLKAKYLLGDTAAEVLELDDRDARIRILPLELDNELFNELNVSDEVPRVMSKYMIHNQSFLTDFTFIGFPFHYFYTAVFLLILFVFLCWLYCVQTDKMEDRLAADQPK